MNCAGDTSSGVYDSDSVLLMLVANAIAEIYFLLLLCLVVACSKTILLRHSCCCCILLM